MGQNEGAQDLAPQTVDYVTSAVKAIVGAAPFVGSLLVEIAGVVIPNQRMDRIARFAQALEARLSELEQDVIRSQLTNESFTDLMEEGLRQAAQSLSEDRRAHIAAIVSNSLNTEEISYVESKHLLRILGELNDIEVIRLGRYMFDISGSGEAYWEKHREILAPVGATFDSSQQEIDRNTLQSSYDEHLARLGLLGTRYKIDSRTKQPEFDSRTGGQTVRGHELSGLGRLFCRQIGLSEEEPGHKQIE